MRRFVAIFYVLLLMSTVSRSQTVTIPNPQLPIIQAPQAPNPYQFPSRETTVPMRDIGSEQIQRQNQQLIDEAVEAAKRYAQKDQLLADIRMLSTTGFPSQSYQEGTANYYSAFRQIDSMLQGKKPLDLGKAVFVVENAYYGNSLNYVEYQKSLDSKVQFCKQKIEEEKLDAENDLVKNMMLFRFISDTLKMKYRETGQIVTHYPVKYDLEDYKSEKNFDSHFVTKLMRSGSGQCYSMPLYYLVLAEKIGAKAYWSFSPRHSFVKIQDNDGSWYNLELTCSAILSDAHYMNSSYIKAEAIRNRIYLEPMDKKEIVAEMLIELARGYYVKYGLDDFYLACADTASRYLSNKLDPLMMKSIYETHLTLTLANLLEAPNPQMMKEKSLESYKHYEAMQSLYEQIDNLGYEEIPADIYTTWLKHVEKLKMEEKQNKKMFINLKKAGRNDK